MNPLRHVGFACPECGVLHSLEIDALRCCRAAIRHEDYWDCECCGSDYNDFREALACCHPEDVREVILNRPTSQELEMAGQLRLIC